MKDLLERLRLWLIEKLGGYTKQQIIVHRDPPVQWIRPQIQQVWAEAHIPLERACWIDKDAWEYTEMELAEALSWKLIRGNFVAIQTTHDKLRDKTVMRATVMAVSGKDVAIHEEWGPTPEYDDWRRLRPL